MNFLGFVWGAAQPQSIALGLNLLIRLGLSGTFLASAVGKLMDLPGARQALGDFGVPSSFVRTGAVVLCYLELALAVGLMIDQSSRPACLGVTLLMLAMSAGIGRLLHQKRKPPCHCFGAIHSAPVGWVTLIRAMLLAALAVVAMILPLFALTSSFRGLVGILALFALSAYATRAYVKSLPVGTRVADTLLVGQRLPAVRLRGGRWLEDSLPNANRTLLLFTSTNCPACEFIKTPLARWIPTLEGHLPILEIRAVNDEEPGMEFQVTYEDLSKFHLSTPGAILVDRSGVILAPPVSNIEQIESLLRVTLRERHVC